jgi:hypothetical protein
MKLTKVFLALLALQSVSAQAQESWDFKVIPYLWMVGIDGTMSVGPVDNDLDVSFSDILSDMDIGGSVVFRGMRGKHGFHLDYTYLRLKPDPMLLPAPPFPEGSGLNQKLTINILEAAYNYELPMSGASNAQFLIGARNTDMEIKLRSNNGYAPINLSGGPSMLDYFVGVRTETPIGEGKWAFNFMGTIGGGDTDLPWTLQGVFSRKFENNNRLAIGARIWNLDFTEPNGIMGLRMGMDVKMAGLMIGYVFD